MFTIVLSINDMSFFVLECLAMRRLGYHQKMKGKKKKKKKALGPNNVAHCIYL
jgi:hypothetical protein